MYPVLFEIFGRPVTTFGLMVVIGFLVGANAFTRYGLRYEQNPEEVRPRLDAIPFWLLVGVIIGARLMYVAVEIGQNSPQGQRFLKDPFSILFVFEGGLVMYGGVMGALLAGLYATRKHGLRFVHLVDTGITVAFLGIGIGRIGCLLVGDDYGSQVPENWQHLPFPFTITVPEELPEGSLFGQENAGKKLWATQIWMSANCLMLFVIGNVLLNKRKYYGQVALKLLVLYSIGRFIIEMFRGDSVRGLWFGGAISTSQLISILIFLACGTMLFLFRGRTDPIPEPPVRVAT